jgi:CAAX protease family protein
MDEFPQPPDIPPSVSPSPATPLALPQKKLDFFRSSNLFFVLIRIGIFILLSKVISAALLFIVPGDGPRRLSAASPQGLVVGEGTAFLGLFAAGLLMARLERRKFGDYGLPARRDTPKRFLQGALFGLVEISAVIGVIAAFGAYHFGDLAVHGMALLRWAAFWGIFFLVVGFYEEFSFRGYPQFTLAQATGFWPAALLLSCGFGAVHLGNTGENWVGIAGIVLTGLFWSFTLRRTGDLWFAVGMHASFDFGETFLYSVPDSGLVFPGHLSNATLAGPAWLTGGNAGPEGSLLDFIVLLIFFCVFHLLYPSVPATAPTRDVNSQ